jgi:hypothetical protein
MTDIVFKVQRFISFPIITLAHQINLGNPEYLYLCHQICYIIHIQTTISSNPKYISHTIPTTLRSINGYISLANFLFSFEGNNIISQVGLNTFKAIIQLDLNSLHPATRAEIRQ